jgi:tRNA C32,U32 (ribose-2'-O)-methylase TrmJ
MQATIKDAQKIVKKAKKPRTSTIDETVATANQGIKPLKKATKTKTMAQTLKDAQASNATPVKRKAAKKTKKVTKKAVKKAGAQKQKSKAQKKK